MIRQVFDNSHINTVILYQKFGALIKDKVIITKFLLIFLRTNQETAVS